MAGRRFDERAKSRAGAVRLAGVDEAGRGPLAGPVVVAAVILPERFSRELARARDSKTLTAAARERLFALIRKESMTVSVAWAYPNVVDRDNILRATLRSMSRAARRALEKTGGLAGAHVLVDGPHRIPDPELAQEAVVDGDGKSLCVAAAGIVAKVVRDRWMARLERRYPGYGFAKHKGYGTAEHLASLQRLGPCTAHRRSFAPVAEAAK